MASLHPPFPIVHVRGRPELQIDIRGPPSNKNFVRFYHPGHNLSFLTLPAYDCYMGSTSDLLYGIHCGTAITACQILTYNKSGYLSTSQNPGATERVDANMDAIIASGRYYYHLVSPPANGLYPICTDFASWRFPHEDFPEAWIKELPIDNSIWPSNWTAVSEKIKFRDANCLVSGWSESLTTARIVPKSEEAWLSHNDMDTYLLGDQPFHQDPRNLFALRWDLDVAQFDQAKFDIVPKSGVLVIHFLQSSQENAQQYHNVQFDPRDHLSHQLLYARFAWALIKIVKESSVADLFSFQEPSDDDIDDSGMGGGGGKGPAGGGGGGGGGGGKGPGAGREPGRKRRRGNDGGTSADKPGRSTRSGKHNSTACPPKGKTGLGIIPRILDADVIDPDGSRLSLDHETQELEEDMKKAARAVPFFVDPTRKVEPWQYDNIVWYPGKAAVERRKQAYLDAHPHIWAHGSHTLPDDYNSSDNENTLQ